MTAGLILASASSERRQQFLAPAGYDSEGRAAIFPFLSFSSANCF
ncbi:MAG: hypothetical protein SXA11_19690 [Cyanobacteriota bacterium]|nr:hypothetical protein [Cyanobacteriota bacterium]